MSPLVPKVQARTSFTAELGQFINRHPRSITTTVVICLLGCAATAFGLSPLAPDAAELPRQLLVEKPQSLDLSAQLDALSELNLSLFRGDITRSSDTADSLLKRLNIDDPAAAAFLRNDNTARKILSGRPGKMVQARTNAQGRLEELVARYPAEQSDQIASHFSKLTVRLNATSGGFSASQQTLALSNQIRMGSGSIRSSLFAATDEARIPDSIAVQMAEIFSADLDFHRELRKGDNFSVVFEIPTADGEPINWNQGTGRVLAAEFINKGRSYSAVWYSDASGKGQYFDLNGQSKHRTYLSSPMEFSRVTSGFAMRFHPILQTWRQHKGVDYGAPMGTPVRTVADGVVDFAGWQNGYGNVVSVKHDGDKSTLYAHLSRIDVKRGEKVSQGEHIGTVGATGWATGPHLHFEFKIKGEHQDPLILAKSADTVTINAASRPQFQQLALYSKDQLKLAQTLSNNGQTAE